MIDQTKDKKDDGLKQKLDKEKKEGRKADAQKTLDRNDTKANAAKGNASSPGDKGVSNTAKASAPIGSATITSNEVEMHSGPSKSGTKMNPLKGSSRVDILGRQGDELKVMVNGQIGYIAADKTDYENNTEAKKAAPKPVGTASITASAIHVRKGPGTDTASMGVLNQADKVKVYGEKNGFLEIHIGDEVGYISATYTDFASKSQGTKLKPEQKVALALSEAPEALRDLLAKENMTESEIAQAREMIEQCPESIKGDLFAALQTKPAYIATQKNKKKSPVESKNGAGLENLAASLTLLGIRNPSTELPFETYLEQVKRDQKIPGQNTMESWGAIANAMGVSYSGLCMPGNRMGLEKQFWTEAVREQLRKGNAVMACIQNHTVRIEAIEDKGIVLTMPESDTQGFTGLGSGYTDYSGKASQKANGRRGLLSFESLSQASLQWVISMH